MTAAELRAVVQDYIGPNNGQRPLQQATIDQLVNQACLSVFHEITNWRSRKETSINVVAGTTDYDLPSDTLSILSVTYQNSSTVDPQFIRPVAHDEKHLYSATGATEQAYVVVQGSTAALSAIRLLVTPTVSYTAGLKVRYRRRPALLSTFQNTDEFTEVDAALHLALAQEAAWLYLSRQGSKALKEYQGMHQYFQDQVLNEKRRHQETWQSDHLPAIDIQYGGLFDA